MSVTPLFDDEFVARRVCAPAHEVVFVKAVLEASEGLAAMFAERGGDLTLVAHRSQQRALDLLIADLECERLLRRLPGDDANPSDSESGLAREPVEPSAALHCTSVSS